MSSVNPSTRVAVHLPPPQDGNASDVASSADTNLAVPLPVPVVHGTPPLTLESLPADALENTADDLSPQDRAAFAESSRYVHAAVTQAAQDPLTDAVYKAQAEFRRRRDLGVTGPPLERARARVKAAVELAAKRQGAQLSADYCLATRDWRSAAHTMGQLGQYARQVALLTQVVQQHPTLPFAHVRLAQALARTGDSTSARTHAQIARELSEYSEPEASDLLAMLDLIEGHLHNLELNGIAPVRSSSWGLHAAVAEMKARDADDRGNAAEAAQWRVKAQHRLEVADTLGQLTSRFWYHAFIGESRAALNIASEQSASIYEFQVIAASNPELLPFLIGALATDETARNDWVNFLRSHFALPEQLATLRWPSGT